jgi:hypothetical protein
MASQAGPQRRRERGKERRKANALEFATEIRIQI